ncbi:MAG: outer membrane beta-barrel protein [Salinivirgaceae bacterium]|nr:outer membrane beta-barrel protein [Salinivirgaceae bacterium]
MKLHKFITVFLFILSLSNAVAQSNFIEGYYIDSNEDTITGLINYQNWDKNPEEINFKANVESHQIALKPNEIKGFNINNLIYKAATIEIERSPIKLEALNKNPEFDIIERTVFLQILFEGENNLYRYKDEFHKLNLYIGDISNPSLLLYKKYIKFFDKTSPYFKSDQYTHGDLVLEEKTYIGQLLNIFNQDQGYITKIQKTEYSEREILHLFIDFQKEKKIIPNYIIPKSKNRVNFSVISAVVLTDIHFNSSLTGLYYYEDVNFKTESSYVPGIALDIQLSKNRKNWIFRNELLYASYNLSGSFSNFANHTNLKTFNATFNYSYLKYNLLLKRNFIFDNHMLFMNVGLNVSFMMSGENSYSMEYTYGLTNTGELFKESYYNKSEREFIAGIGYSFKHIGIETRISRSTGFSNDLSMGFYTNRSYFLFTYTF